MPPHEDAGADGVLTFRFHPLAVLKLSNRIREYRLHDYQHQAARGSSSAPACAIARPPRMFGCVIGVQRGRTVEVVDTSGVLLDTDPGTLDRALLEKKQEIYKKAFPGFTILGWYSIGTHVTDTDLETNQTLMDTSGTAFYLLLNPAMNLSQKDLPVTIHEKEAERISVDHSADLSPCHLVASDVSAPPLGKRRHAKIMRPYGFKLMLFETPSGFTMFHVSQKLIARPRDIWARFAYQSDITDVIVTLGFIQVHNKSVARDVVVGPGDKLKEFILGFCTHKYLIVQDVELKDVIEKKLNIYCYCNPTVVDELTWGLNYVLPDLLPEEQSLTDECYIPLSKAMAKQMDAYGFKISPRERYSVLLVLLFGQYLKSYDMSDLEFAKSITSRLRSSEEMVPRDERYSRDKIMEFIDFIIAAPGNRSRTLSFLRRIEAASIDDSTPAEMGASVQKHLRLDWIGLCCLGCTIALEAFYRRVIRKMNYELEVGFRSSSIFTSKKEDKYFPLFQSSVECEK
uniref:JAB1/MPN/MOV34 metalloenzyme domain-containing protein n=1 Tax=Oryza punctata TaxID=4537 RepID=A0A0E0MPR0_ORYPU